MNENDLDLLDNHVLILGHSELIDAVFDEVGKFQDMLLVMPDRDLPIKG